MPIADGIFAGIAAGIIMGLVSEIGYRLGLFTSSLIMIDGSFAGNRLRKPVTPATMYAFGAIIHLLTSALFGSGYVVATWVLNVPAQKGLTVTIYVLLLWIAMLFVALPIAGQGILGKKLGQYTWMEQLVLHIVFGIVLWLTV